MKEHGFIRTQYLAMRSRVTFFEAQTSGTLVVRGAPLATYLHLPERLQVFMYVGLMGVSQPS